MATLPTIPPPASSASTSSPAAAMGAAAQRGRLRVDSVDVLRGLVMILMALDHTRDYFGDVGANPTNLATTTVPLFFTRWITHICAPVFFLLTGVGAYLALRHRSPAGLSRFLLTRGLWLILLEVTLISFGWYFTTKMTMGVVAQVIWVIGASMVVLAGLVHLPRWAIAAPNPASAIFMVIDQLSVGITFRTYQTAQRSHPSLRD